MAKISPAMMAEALGVPVQAIRVGLQQNKLDFGVAIQPSGKKYTYIIYPEKARTYVGSEKLKEWGF